MLKTIRAVFATVLIWSLSLSGQAVTLDNLYQGQATVPTTSESDRGLGFVLALRQVLVKASGQRGLIESTDTRLLAQRAEAMVQSFRYLEGASGETLLQASFAPAAVERLLAELGARVWGANRPQLLVWAAVSDGAQRLLLTPSSEGWASAWASAADTRGVPVRLPEVAPGAALPLNLADVWGHFMEPVQAASVPYQADVIVAVRISPAGNGWRAAWRMAGAVPGEQGELAADSPQLLVDRLLDEWAGLLSERYAVSTTGTGIDAAQVELVIESIANAQHYAAVRQAVAAMSVLSGAYPVLAEPGQLTYRFGLGGGAQVVREYVALDRRFEFVGEEASTTLLQGQDAPVPVTVIRYRWRGEGPTPPAR